MKLAIADSRPNPNQDKARSASPPERPLSPRNEQKAHTLGLTSATGLVIGSIVGTGVFTMPAIAIVQGSTLSAWAAS